MYSMAAWESWQDIFYGVAAKLIDPPPLVFGLAESPWVIDVNRNRLTDEKPQ